MSSSTAARMSNSDRRWQLTEQTMIRVQINLAHSSSTMSKTQWRETLIKVNSWPPNAPGTQEAKGDSQQLTPTPVNNTRGLGEQIHNCNKVTQRFKQNKLHQAQNKCWLRDASDNAMHMVFECFAVELYAKDVEVGTGANGNPRQDQVNMGRVHNPGSINNWS